MPASLPPSRPPWAPPSAEPRPPSAPGPADLTPSWVSCWGVEAPGSGRGQLTDSGLGRPSKSSACSEWDGRWTEPARQPKRHHVQPAVRPETPHLSAAVGSPMGRAPHQHVSTARPVARPASLVCPQMRVDRGQGGRRGGRRGTGPADGRERRSLGTDRGPARGAVAQGPGSVYC